MSVLGNFHVDCGQHLVKEGLILAANSGDAVPSGEEKRDGQGSLIICGSKDV